MSHHKLIIIGAGPAGYTAGIYAGRADLEPFMLAGPEPGGQLTTTTDVENYPGYPAGIMGPQMMEDFKKQAVRFGTKIEQKIIDRVDFSQPLKKMWAGEEEYTADTVIIATGAAAKWLGLESEQRLRGKGVSACATCDGFFFKDKVVAVVGGGDTAMEEATFLTKFATKVYVLVRKDESELRASEIMKKRAMENEKIEFRFHTEIKEVLGEESVIGLQIVDNQKNEESTLEIGGLFLGIGHKPNTEFLKGTVAMDQNGYIVLSDKHVKSQTSIPGVFAAGDVADHRYRQAVTAAGMGCQAAIDVERYLSDVEAAEAD